MKESDCQRCGEYRWQGMPKRCPFFGSAIQVTSRGISPCGPVMAGILRT